MRSSDVLFRVGGEKFVILLSDTDLADAELVAESIRNTIESHVLTYQMSTIKITASLGVGTLRTDDTVDAFIQRADDAMYKAKRSGRSQVMLAH